LATGDLVLDLGDVCGGANGKWLVQVVAVGGTPVCEATKLEPDDAPAGAAGVGFRQEPEPETLTVSRAELLAREQQFDQAVRQVQQERGVSERVATQMVEELTRIMSLDDVNSFDQWEQFKFDYSNNKAKAELNYWRERAEGHEQRAYQQQEQAALVEYLPHLQKSVRQFADEAVESVRQSHLSKLSPEAQRAFGDRLHKLLIEEADEGRIFFHTGERLPGTTLPKLDVDFGRIATIAAREVKQLKTYMEIERAAQFNANAEAERRYSAAPPGLSARPDTSGGSGRGGSGGSARSWADLLQEVKEI
jgi:hypothetical protein